MWASSVIEAEVASDGAERADAVVGPQIHFLGLMLRHRRSTNTLSRQAPLPSMLIAMPLSASTPVKAEPVNCEPWSVFEDVRLAVTSRELPPASRRRTPLPL